MKKITYSGAFVGVLLSAFSTLAQAKLVKDFKNEADLVETIKKYLGYHTAGEAACKGIDRSSGVKVLSLYQDTVNGKGANSFHLRGFVWANSLHPHGLAYGSACQDTGEDVVGDSVLKVKFDLPIKFERATIPPYWSYPRVGLFPSFVVDNVDDPRSRDRWVPDYKSITEIPSGKPLPKISQTRVRGQSCGVDALACVLYWICVPAVKNEIDIEKIFELSSPYFPNGNVLLSDLVSEGDLNPSGQESLVDQKTSIDQKAPAADPVVAKDQKLD